MTISPPPCERITNLFLRSLSERSLRTLRPQLHPAVLPHGRILERVDGEIDDLYFVDRGLVSLVKTMCDGRAIEVGAVGIEGLTDATALFGVETAVLEAIVQIPGEAWRIGRKALLEAATNDRDLHRQLTRYMRFAIAQLAQNTACNRLHTIEERCARWLLICHDNAGSDEFPLTHEFLAMMLGVQRPGVTLAANILRRAGLIEYGRGRVRIVDRAGLEAVSCECWAETHRAIEELYGVEPERIRARS